MNLYASLLVLLLTVSLLFSAYTLCRFSYVEFLFSLIQLSIWIFLSTRFQICTNYVKICLNCNMIRCLWEYSFNYETYNVWNCTCDCKCEITEISQHHRKPPQEVLFILWCYIKSNPQRPDWLVRDGARSESGLGWSRRNCRVLGGNRWWWYSWDGAGVETG